MSQITITDNDFNYELILKCLAIIVNITSGVEQKQFLKHLKKYQPD